VSRAASARTAELRRLPFRSTLYVRAVPEWDADVEVDASLVDALLAEQFPELDATSARLLGEGWDNSVWLVEETWAFRFPRRAIAVPLVARELAVLPRIAAFVSIDVPVPRFVGTPSERFPRPFFGHALLPGRELAEAGLPASERTQLGADLGRFLRALHTPEHVAAVDPGHELPVDPNRRADMAVCVPKARERVAALAEASRYRAAVERLLAVAEQLAPSSSLTLLHGDLHARHVLVDGGTISALIDWGDTCRGDPSIDLQVAWTLLAPGKQSTFFEAYGPIDEETRLRARVLAVSLSAMLVLYARDQGRRALELECLAGLERALVEA
jgi:aminoglycoside phosphotransferase (APT) family kinase protein